MEDSATSPFVVDSNVALEIKLVRCVEDLENKNTTFGPDMTHQVFGDRESIFGYRDLRVKLYYAAGCLETYLGMTYSEKVNKTNSEGVEADEVLSKIATFLAPQVHNNIDSFIESLKKDDTFIPHGELLHSFTAEDLPRHDMDDCTRKFEIYKADMSIKGFREYHQRLRTFVLWYIDAGCFIDMDDDRWHYFNMFEKYQTTNGTTRYATAGFATVYQYYAYPNNTRPRIAQVLVLPNFQNMTLGAHLLQAIYRYYIGSNEVIDTTVEDPSDQLQRIRDYVDAISCIKLSSFSPACLRQGFSKAMVTEAREKLKINRKQARRIYEILRLRVTDLTNEEEYRNYRLDVKKRLNLPFRREQHDIRKLETALKNVDKRVNVFVPTKEQRLRFLETEYASLEDEYKKVIKRLEYAEEL